MKQHKTARQVAAGQISKTISRLLIFEKIIRILYSKISRIHTQNFWFKSDYHLSQLREKQKRKCRKPLNLRHF